MTEAVDRMNTVALYARVSTKKQDEVLQIPKLQRLAEMRGLTIYQIYQDEASGKDQNRPQWQRLMNDARLGKFGAIMAVKLDRIMRSVANLNTVMQTLGLYRVRLITEDLGEIDISKPQGKFVMQIIAAIAEWERETISSRTKEALDEKREQGIIGGRRRREDLPLLEIAEDRRAGLSWDAIVKKRRIPKGTLFARKAEIEAYLEGESE